MRPEIQIGMRVMLFIPPPKKMNMEKDLALPSIVEKLQGEEYIFIQMPTYQGYFYPLPQESLLLRFFLDSEPYSLHVQFEERMEENGFMLAKLKRISPIQPHQMRESYRLNCSLPLTIERRLSDKRLLETSIADGLTIDLSEGGMLLSTNEQLQEGESINVSFDIGSKETVESLVLRVEEIPKAKYRFKAGLKFNHQHKNQARRIYRYIVRVQVAQMRRD